jgi:hypothetical protein
LGSRSSDDGSSHTAHQEDPDVSDATAGDCFAPPDLTSFCRLDGFGLVATGQRVTATAAFLACRVASAAGDRWCDGCGGRAIMRDTVAGVGARTVRVAADDIGGQRAPLRVRAVRAGLASGHQPRRGGQSETVAAGADLDARSARRRSPHRRPDRRGARGGVGQRQRRGAGRGTVGADL